MFPENNVFITADVGRADAEFSVLPLGKFTPDVYGTSDEYRT